MEYEPPYTGFEITGYENAYRDLRAYGYQANGIGFAYLQKNKLPTAEAFDRADELKMIIHNRDDFSFAEKQAEKVTPNVNFIFNLNGVSETR